MEKFTVHTPGLVYLKANPSFSGDHNGMWYRFHYTGQALSVCVWPLPYCFDKTQDALKTFAEFPFDADGLAQAEHWVEQQYDRAPKQWAQSPFLPIAEPAPAQPPADAAPADSDDDAPPFDL